MVGRTRNFRKKAKEAGHRLGRRGHGANPLGSRTAAHPCSWSGFFPPHPSLPLYSSSFHHISHPSTVTGVPPFGLLSFHYNLLWTIWHFTKKIPLKNNVILLLKNHKCLFFSKGHAGTPCLGPLITATTQPQLNIGGWAPPLHALISLTQICTFLLLYNLLSPTCSIDSHLQLINQMLPPDTIMQPSGPYAMFSRLDPRFLKAGNLSVLYLCSLQYGTHRYRHAKHEMEGAEQVVNS